MGEGDMWKATTMHLEPTAITRTSQGSKALLRSHEIDHVVYSCGLIFQMYVRELCPHANLQ